MLKLSANLGFLWPDRPLLARIEAAAAAGFQAVELHWPYDVPAAELKAALDKHALKLLGINTPVGDRPGDFGMAALAGREEEFLHGFDQTLRYAQEAGASAIHVMASVVPASERDEARRIFIGNLQRVATAAERAGIGLLLEPINRRDKPDYLFNNVADAVDIIAQVGSPALSLMFDFYHAGWTEADPLACFERHAAHVGHIQIAAWPSRVEPNDSHLDYEDVFRRIVGSDYRGWIGCEYKPRADTDAGLVWRDKLLSNRR
jgi:2-dehydrotetronate isomerase